jgi:hypothetical protein
VEAWPNFVRLDCDFHNWVSSGSSPKNGVLIASTKSLNVMQKKILGELKPFNLFLFILLILCDIKNNNFR